LQQQPCHISVQQQQAELRSNQCFNLINASIESMLCT
jgi:hypothetical protein